MDRAGQQDHLARQLVAVRAQAAQDPEFRRRLLREPRRTLEAAGVPVPLHRVVRVVEVGTDASITRVQDGGEFLVLLPPRSSGSGSTGFTPADVAAVVAATPHPLGSSPLAAFDLGAQDPPG